MSRIVVPDAASPARLDKILAELCPEVSRATFQRWISEERVLVDGRVGRAKEKVGPGAVIEYSPGPPPPSRAEADASVVLDVVFEDDHVLVVNKPAGLVVHPGRGNWTGTLVNGLLARPGFEQAPTDAQDPDGALRPGIVHRIDKDTSGLLVVAKTVSAREGLKELFQTHDIERAYVALTAGVPRPGTIDTLHGRHPKNRLKFSSLVSEGKAAVTHIEVVESYAQRAALVRATLETGRTHQIRVHLAEQCRTPILGDALYGGAGQGAQLGGVALTRQALHAAVLGFVHPVTSERLHFEAALPADMQRAIEGLRVLTG